MNRSAAVFLTISLLFSSTGQAAPVVISKTENTPSFFQTAIPKGFGKVEESFVGTSGKTIYYIQDAHDSLEAQKHIAGLIRHFVKREGVRTVFEEGYEGPVPTEDYFGFIKNPAIREKVSYFLMDKLRLGGAEYAHVNRRADSDFKLMGADSLALHRENIRWYQKNAQSQQATSQDLAVLQAEIEKIAQKHLPKKLKDWIRLKKKFDHQELGLLDYLQRTNQLGIPFDNYPHIALILLAARRQDPAIQQKLAVMDVKELFEEIESLESQVGYLLGGEGLGLKVVEYFRMLELYQRLNQISLTPSEYQVAKGLIKSFDTGKIAEFIVRQTGKSLAFSARWENQIQNAVQFYETAHARDEKIEENLKAFLENPDERKAVLVFGGFHKEAIKRILTRQNFSWAVITPKIGQLDSRHSGYYKQLMSVGHHAFEKPFVLNKAARAESIVQIEGRSEIEAIYKAAERLELLPFLSRDLFVSAMERELLKTNQHSRSEVRVNPGIASILNRNYPETLAGAQEIIKDTIKWLIDDMHHEEEPLLREFSALIESAENMQDGGFNKSRNFLDAASPLKIQINAKLLYRYWQISKELLEKGVNPTSYYFETLAAPILRESRGALFIKNMRSNETLEVLRTINQQFPPIPREDVFPSASGYTYIPLKDLIHRFVVYFGAGEFYEGIWHLKAFQWARENGLYDFKEIRALLDQKHIQTNDRYEHLFADDITQTDILAQEIKNHTVYALRQFVQYGLKYPGERAFYYFFLLQIGNKNFNGGRLPTDKLMQLVNRPGEVSTAEFIPAARSIEAEMLQLFNHFQLTVPDEENLKRSETRTLKIQIQTLLTTFEREIQWLPLEKLQKEALLEDVNNFSMHIPVNPDQIHGFIQKVIMVENTFPLSAEIKAKFREFQENLEQVERDYSGAEPASLDEFEEEFVQEARRDVFGPVYEAGENAILEKKIYTEESLNQKQVKAWGGASIRERVAGADGKPSLFYSLSAAIYPQGPEAEAIRRHWEKIHDDFKSQRFAKKFYVSSFEAFNLTLRWLAFSSKTPYPKEKIEAAEITMEKISDRLQPFDIWIQGLSINPENGQIVAEAVFLNERISHPRFIPLFTPFHPLDAKEINGLISWIEDNRDIIFGRVRVEKVSLVHSRNVFAGDNISKKEYPLIVTRSEVRVTERIQRELWALDYVELSKKQTSLAKLVLDLKELEEKIQSLGMPDKRVAVIYPLVFSINAILKINPDFATPFVETKIKDALTRQIPAAKQAAKIEFIYESFKKRVEARFSYPDKAILLNYIIMGPQVNMYAEKSEENGGKVTARFHALLDGKISGTLDYFQPGAAQIVNQTTGQPLEIPAVDIEAAAPLLDYYIVFDWMTRSKTTDDEARRGANFLNNLFALYPGILADFYLPQFIESLKGTRFFYKDGEIHLYSDAGAKDGQIQNWLGEIKKSGKVMDIPPSKMADLVAALPVNQFVRDLVSPIELIAAPDVYAMAFHSLWDSPIIIHSVRYGQIKPTLEAAMQLAAVILSDERISIEITRSADQKSGEVITRYADPLNRELMLEWFAKSGNGESEGVVFFSIEEERDKGWYRVRKYIKDPQDFLRRRSEVRTTGNPKLWLNPNPPATMQKPEPAIHEKVLRDYEDLLKNVKKTPLVQLDRISQLTGKKVFLKNDAQQYGGSFKIRGVYWEVYSAIKTLLEKPDAKQILRNGFKIVTQSTGNHGIAMIKSLELILSKMRKKYERSDPELAQLLLNIEPLIFTLKEIPEPKYPAMQQALRDYQKLVGENKGEIRNLYDTYESALGARKDFIEQQQDHAVYIRHASAETTFGYGSAGIEIAEQLKAAGISENQKVVLIFPVGAGGPIGFATGLRLVRFENTYAVMAQSDRWDAFVRSLQTGRLEKNEQPIKPTDVIKNPDGTETSVWFTDGSAVDSPEEFAIDLAKGHLDAAVAVDERAAYDFSGPLLLADLKDHMGDLARVGGTTALTAEALLTQAGNISVIKDADVVVLFGTEGSVSPYVHTHLEDQLPELNTIKERYQKRSEVRSFEDYQEAVALLVDEKEEVYEGLKLAARLDDSTKTAENRLIAFRKLMDRQANTPGKTIGKAEVLNSLFKSFDNSDFMQGDPTHDSRPDYSILNKVIEGMAANHPDFPATDELVERTARITFEYFIYQSISLLTFRAYEDWRNASPESGRDATARTRIAAVQKMLEDFSAASFQKFDTDPLLSLQFLSSYLSFYETEYYKLDGFIEVLGLEALARWDEYTLRLIGRHLRGVFYDSDRLWEHRWINVADYALLIRSLNRELARYQAAKQSGNLPAIKRHVQNILEGLSPDAAFLTSKEDMSGFTRDKDPLVITYDGGTRIYPTDDAAVWKSYWNLLDALRQPLREDMIEYAEPAEFAYSTLGRMDLYWAGLAKYMILASILKSGHEKLGFRDLLESDAARPATFKEASEKLRWHWWIDYRGKNHIADSLDALRYYGQERVNTYYLTVLAALKPRSEALPRELKKLSGTGRSEVRADSPAEISQSSHSKRNAFDVINLEILRMFNQLQGMVTDPMTPLSMRLLENELKLIPYSKKLARLDGKSLPPGESLELLSELQRQRDILTAIKNNPTYQMDLKPNLAGLFDAHLQYLIEQIDVLTSIISPATEAVTPAQTPRSEVRPSIDALGQESSFRSGRSEVRPNASALGQQSSSGTGRSEVREKQNPPTMLSDLIGEKAKRVVDYATGLGDWPRELRENSHKWLAVNAEIIPVDLDKPIEYPMYQKKGGFGSVKEYQQANLGGLEVITPSAWEDFLKPDDSGKVKEIDLLHAAFLHNPPTTLSDLDKFETNVRIGGWVLIAHTDKLYHHDEMIKWLKGRGYEDGNIYVYDRDTGFPVDYPITYWWTQYVRLRQNYIIVAQKTRNLFRSEVRENSKVIEARRIEKMSVPAGVFLDAKELALIPAAQLDKQLDEILALVSRHKAFDVYIDGADRFPVQQFKNPKIQKLLAEHSNQIHLGTRDRANLTKKQILIHASFLEGAGSRAETQDMIEGLRKRYGVKVPVSALEYRQAGSLKAFLDLAEKFKPGELIRGIGEAFAVLGQNGRWRVAQDFVATIWSQVQASYRIQWSA